MTPAPPDPSYEIGRAIEKLESLKAATTTWSVVNGWIAEDGGGSTYVGGMRVDDGREPLTNDPVLVTLYATLDAQLTILNETRRQHLVWANAVGRYAVDPDGHVLALARAINEAGAP